MAMIDRTSRLTVVPEAAAWDQVLNALADGPYRVTAPLIAEIQRQCMQHDTVSDTGETLHRMGMAARGNGEASSP
jgi:hypothetical protein